MAYEVILPKLGQTVEESSIVEWMKAEGDEVARGDVLFTVETDKATLDVEATRKGFLRKILVPAGEEVPVLTVVAYITRTADEPLDVSESSEGVGEKGSAGVGEGESSSVAADDTPTPLHPSSPTRIFASPRAATSSLHGPSTTSLPLCISHCTSAAGSLESASWPSTFRACALARQRRPDETNPAAPRSSIPQACPGRAKASAARSGQAAAATPSASQHCAAES